MSIRVPFLNKEQIERDVEALLAEFANKRGSRVFLPIPIEDIVEKHLKYGSNLTICTAL
jgi:pimeloyl-CoA synthetase